MKPPLYSSRQGKEIAAGEAQIFSDRANKGIETRCKKPLNAAMQTAA
jgi:hypothetical protein